jgi:hypothetical protein
MINAIALRAPFSLHRFHMSVASDFSNNVGRENIRIQCQLPEISVVFYEGCLPRKALHFVCRPSGDALRKGGWGGG